MIFIAGFGLGVLVTIGAVLIFAGDIDNNTDFR